MTENSRIKILFESGYVKSLFSHSDYRSPEEMREDLLSFARARNFVEATIAKIDETLWRLRFIEEVEVKEPVPRTVRYMYHFYILHHGQFWEFLTNERRYIINRIVVGLIEFLPKLEYKFLPPYRIISLAKEYEMDELLAFTAKRDYFSLAKASSELRIVSDKVNLRLRSSPENIWEHYHILVEEEPIGPLSIGAIQVRILSGEKTCTLWINTLGQILQTAGDRDIFYDVREKILQIFEQQRKWEYYIPIVETQVVEDKEKGITIRGQQILRKGRRFAIKLSKPFELRDYEKLKGLFIFNFKRSGLVGVIEDEIRNKSFVARTTDMRGGGDAILIVTVGQNDIVVDPQPSTTIRTLEKIYSVILEKFDTKAVLVEPETE